MKLSISNIAWDAAQDDVVYTLMRKYGYFGLEIAPTRILPEAPYDQIEVAEKWSKELLDHWGFSVSSLQSIWYGRQEKIFGTNEERQFLINYTKKAIDFAAAVGCGNLVFGCPRNRNFPEGADAYAAIAFFRELGDYAAAKGTVIGMEANPTIYNTNYINDTRSALNLIKQVDSKGFLLNLDVGTIIQNGEDVAELINNVHLVNHVHISEPGLKPIEKRSLHQELKNILTDENYGGFISIEMAKVEKVSIIDSALKYLRSIFAEGSEG